MAEWVRRGGDRWIWRLPVVGPRVRAAYHRLRAPLERAATQRLLARTPHPFAPRLARVLKRMHAKADSATGHLAAIEQERAALLLCDEALADGSLGPARRHDVDATVASACRVSKASNAARLLYLLVREFCPERALELGTNLGISSAYLAAAMVANGTGRLVTLEASPYRLRLARQMHARLGLHVLDYRQGLFAETLDDAVDEFGPFDFAFIDGHHQYEPTLDYFERVWRHSRSDTLFVFDDIRWSEGMERAWATMQSDARVVLALDLVKMGLCVVAREPQTNRRILPISRYAISGKW